MEGFAFLSFVAVIVFASFIYGLVKSWIEQRTKVQEQRLRVLEEAVKSGKLDADVLRGLAATLRPEGIAGNVRTVITFIAWIGLFGVPTFVLVALLLHIALPSWLGLLLMAWFVGGFIYLVATMRTDNHDGYDDGAVI